MANISRDVTMVSRTDPNSNPRGDVLETKKATTSCSWRNFVCLQGKVHTSKGSYDGELSILALNHAQASETVCKCWGRPINLSLITFSHKVLLLAFPFLFILIHGKLQLTLNYYYSWYFLIPFIGKKLIISCTQFPFWDFEW